VKVCFFIWALRAAGAERVLTILANEWAAKGWEIVIVTMEDPDARPFYPLAEAITLLPLNLMKDSSSILGGLANNLERLRVLRRALAEIRPDVVISFIDNTNVLAVLASRGLAIPIIISERTDPSRRSLGRAWGLLRDLAYPRADVIVFQSQGVRDWFPPQVRARGVVIPNPVPLPAPGAPEPSRRDSALRIISLGRLADVKGFDVLVTAFAAIAGQVPDSRLDIYGEGPEREALESLIKALGMGGRITLRGITERPFEALRGADLFVLPSHAEGFPNALVEAMACGLPVISTRFGGAATDIIRDGVDGLLVPPGNPAALGEALVRLLNDPAERARLGGEATGVVERFSMGRVVALWENAIDQAIATGH